MNYGTFVSRFPLNVSGEIARAVSDQFKDLLDQILYKFPQAKATYDPGSINAGATALTTITVPGATVGDVALASHSDVTTSNSNYVNISAKVTAADTVTVYFTNTYSAAVDLASGVLTAVVIKPES